MVRIKIGRLILSRQPKQPKPARTSGRELGASGSDPAEYFTSEIRLRGVKKPSIQQIMNMIDEDGTAAALYNVLTFPVLATNWHIEPHPDDVKTEIDKDGNQVETHPQADRIERALRAPQHEGGMSTPFSLVLADILLAVAQGYRLFEIVYKLDEDGLVTFQKIIAREPYDATIKLDDTGGFNGFEQRVNGKTVHIELPYAFLYTYRKDRNKIKGMSALRAAFYHYDKKHRLYYLANQQGQQAAVMPKILTPPDENVTKEQRDENLEAVDKMAVRPSIALPFGWKLDVVQPGRSVDLLPYINHHDTQMARSVLAQMLMLGTQEGNKGGSFALSSNHTDLFMLGERAMIATIEEHITAFLVSKLHDYNFAEPLYSKFKFDDLSDSVQQLLREAFKSLVSKGSIPDWVRDGISERVAEQLEIAKPDDADLEDDKNDDDAGEGDGDDPKNVNKDDETVDDDVQDDNKSKKTENSLKKKRHLAKSDWWRELTAAEAKVQFAAIQTKADDAEANMLTEVKAAIEKMSQDATTRLKPLLEEKGIKAIDDFALRHVSDLRDALYDGMLGIYGDAKLGAANEISQAAPANKQTSKDVMSRHAQAVADKQAGDLLFELKTIVGDAVRKNKLDKTELSVGDVIAAISAAFAAFFESKEAMTVAAAVSLGVNIGRDDVFTNYKSKIYGYQYSAILDYKVCATCESLDGNVVDEATYYATKWMPPIHFFCRCIWVAILKDEDDKPEYTGIPDEAGGLTEPSLSYGEHMNDPYAVWLTNELRETFEAVKAYGKK